MDRTYGVVAAGRNNPGSAEESRRRNGMDRGKKEIVVVRNRHDRKLSRC
jgi:hypothetical protein